MLLFQSHLSFVKTTQGVLPKFFRFPKLQYAKCIRKSDDLKVNTTNYDDQCNTQHWMNGNSNFSLKLHFGTEFGLSLSGPFLLVY